MAKWLPTLSSFSMSAALVLMPLDLMAGKGTDCDYKHKGQKHAMQMTEANTERLMPAGGRYTDRSRTTQQPMEEADMAAMETVTQAVAEREQRPRIARGGRYPDQRLSR